MRHDELNGSLADCIFGGDIKNRRLGALDLVIDEVAATYGVGKTLLHGGGEIASTGVIGLLDGELCFSLLGGGVFRSDSDIDIW